MSASPSYPLSAFDTKEARGPTKQHATHMYSSFNPKLCSKIDMYSVVLQKASLMSVRLRSRGEAKAFRIHCWMGDGSWCHIKAVWEKLVMCMFRRLVSRSRSGGRNILLCSINQKRGEQDPSCPSYRRSSRTCVERWGDWRSTSWSASQEPTCAPELAVIYTVLKRCRCAEKRSERKDNVQLLRDGTSSLNPSVIRSRSSNGRRRKGIGGHDRGNGGRWKR